MSFTVYVSGPYTQGDPVVNTRNAIEHGEILMGHGIIPVVSHLSMFWHLIFPHDYEFWMKIDLEMLNRCDALYRIEGDSPGSDREVKFAQDKRIRIPVYYDIDLLIEDFENGKCKSRM